MAGFKDSISRGLTTLNVKTSNFMEENKLKTAIATREQEISKLKVVIADVLYDKRNEFKIELVENELKEIENKYSEIEELKKQIEDLSQTEKDILGSNPANAETGNASPTPGKIFCPNCGAENPENFKFCTKCGSKLATE